MKLVIAGSRGIDEISTLKKAIKESPFDISDVDKVITGGADGVDTLAMNFCIDEKINFEVVYPDYDKFSHKVAPIKRNEEMAEKGDCLLAIWDGKSKGTKNMIENSKSQDLDVYVHNTGTTIGDFG